MACYYIVISSTHLRDGQLRSIKGVFRGPIGANSPRNTVRPRVHRSSSLPVASRGQTDACGEVTATTAVAMRLMKPNLKRSSAKSCNIFNL